MKNRVFILIPVHDRLEYTRRCLSSLENQTYKNFEVIILDDGSKDGTEEYIRRKYPFWTILKGDGNLWWTRSMFECVNYALRFSKPGDFMLSLNNDCYAKNDYLEKIVKVSKTNKRAIVGSLVVDADNPKKIIEAGIRINWLINSIYAVTDKMSELTKHSNSNKIITNIDTLPGKGTLFPIEVIKKAGNFNYKRLPHYISDYEFFIRAKRRGFELIVSIDSKLYNFSKATGTTHLTGFKSSYKEVFKALFERKSKLNIVDYFNFILLACPRKYLRVNLKHFAATTLHYLLNLSPFCYVGLGVSKIALFFHNLPIVISQLNKKSMGKYVCKICNGYTYLKYESLFDNRHGYLGKFDIYKCINCGFMETQPQLSPKKLSNIYTKYYPKRDADIKDITTRSKVIPSRSEILKNGWETTCHFQTKKGQKVLDVGCGTCQSLLEIKKLGGKAWGIDPDKNSQKVATALKLNFHLGTIHDFKQSENFFDLITGSQVLEHETDPLSFLIKCKKYLKRSGKIVLSFPNTNALSFMIWGRKWLHFHIPYHLNHFNKKAFEILVKNSGLKIKSIKTVTPNLWTLLQIKSFLNNVKIGERDAMWDGNYNESRSRKQFPIMERLLLHTLPLIEETLIINRAIDYIELGDSFVVELKK